MSRKSNPDKLPTLPGPEKTIRFLEYLRKHTDREHPLKSIKDAREAFRKDRLHLGSDNTIREFYKNIADAYNLDIEQHPLPQSEWRIMYDGYVKLYGDADGEEDLFGEDEPDGMNGDREQFRNLYYVPELSYSEIDALVEAVQLSPTLNQKETAKLISSLEENFASKYYQKGARRICKIHGKSCDRELLRANLLTIQQAIKDGVQIAYRLNGYTKDKKLAPMGDYKRTASPYYIVANDGRYYLLAANEKYKHSGPYIVRIDLMTEVAIPGRDENAAKKGMPAIPKNEVAGLPSEWEEDFPMRHIYMSYGAPVLIKLRIKNEKEKDGHTPPAYTFLYDYFGDSYRYLGIDKNDPDYDIVAVRCTEFGMENFAMQYADKVEVLEPLELREAILKKAQRLAEKYRNPEKPWKSQRIPI